MSGPAWGARGTIPTSNTPLRYSYLSMVMSFLRACEGVRREAAEPRAAAAHERARALQPRKPSDEATDGDAAFHPRQPHARARVDPRGEGHVPVRRAADVQPVRLRELRGIAIGGADADGHQ